MAHLLAEGGMTGPRGLRYTNGNQQNVDELQEALRHLHKDIEVKSIDSEEIEYPGQYRINGLGMGVPNPAITWLKEEGVYGHNSETKFHPDFVWLLTKDQIIEYLRVWWNTDGSISQRDKGNKIYINISLISPQLIKGIQILLLKLGIPSSIRTDIPKVYKGTTKKVWELSIIGNEFKRKFLELIPTYKIPEDYS